jgi:hypothetical protein
MPNSDESMFLYELTKDLQSKGVLSTEDDLDELLKDTPDNPWDFLIQEGWLPPDKVTRIKETIEERISIPYSGYDREWSEFNDFLRDILKELR